MRVVCVCYRSLVCSRTVASAQSSPSTTYVVTGAGSDVRTNNILVPQVRLDICIVSMFLYYQQHPGAAGETRLYLCSYIINNILVPQVRLDICIVLMFLC